MSQGENAMEFPHKCWCGVVLDSKIEWLDHDCDNWEFIVKEQEANEKN
jgi:hypothetical protein